MKITKTTISSPYGLKITQEHMENPNGCLFCFEDINPHVEFRNVLNRKARLKLAWFFFRSLFNTGKAKP